MRFTRSALGILLLLKAAVLPIYAQGVITLHGIVQVATGGGGTAPTITEGCYMENGSSAVGSLQCTYTITAGHLLYIFGLTASGTTQTLTSTGGETITHITTPAYPINNSGHAEYDAWVISSAAGGSETIKSTYSVSSTFSSLIVVDTNGSAYDTGARGTSASGTSGTDVSSASFTTAVANEGLVACGNQFAVPGMTAGTGFTILQQGTANGFGCATKSAGAAGSYTGILHLTGSAGWDVFGAGIKP